MNTAYSKKSKPIVNEFIDNRARICLMCDNEFVSNGPHNRRCKVCVERAEEMPLSRQLGASGNGRRVSHDARSA